MDAKEEKWLISHWQDQADQAERYCAVMYSDFLDTAQQEILLSMQNRLAVKISLDGGYESAERRMASFCPPFLYDQELSYPFCCLEIQLKNTRFLKKLPQHRDYLGAVLGCGIDRRKVGDILVRPEGALIFVCEELVEYLTGNLRQVGAAEVALQRYEQDLVSILPEGKELLISVPSLRLDALLSRGFGMGRSEAAQLIRSGRVQIDHRICDKADQTVSQTAVLTVRGKGRLKLYGCSHTSKSGRLQVRAERFG